MAIIRIITTIIIQILLLLLLIIMSAKWGRSTAPGMPSVMLCVQPADITTVLLLFDSIT